MGRLVKPFCAGFYDGKSLLVWWGEDCVAHLLKRIKKFPGIVYFHNGGKFDLFQLLDDCDPRLFGTGQPIGGRIVKIQYGACEIRDSYALIPKPLASWEKDVIDYRKFEKHRREKHRLEILEYLKGDLRGLFGMVTEFIERYGINLTLASTTIKILDREFGMKAPKLSDRDDAWFRRWYFAGRVQFWGLGRFVGRYAIYDINSAFPAAMLKKHWFSDKWTEGEGWPKTRREQSLYLVQGETNPGYGAFPAREPDKSVSFPTGKFKLHVTGWELLVAIKAGALKSYDIIWHWRPTRIASFGGYVRKFYRMKRFAKNKADAYFAKLLLNALYGKFGSDPRSHREVAIRPYRKPPPGKDWEIAYDDRARGLTFYERPTKLFAHKFFNVCISASITGAVRAFLFAAIRSSRPLYCDTDSLITKRSPSPMGTRLGQWKKEMACDVIWIGGKKLYVAHNRKYAWCRRRPSWGDRKKWVKVDGLGWTAREAFKTASKGVRLPVEDLIAVCEGHQRTGKFIAPTYSLFRATSFTSRRIRRADKRK